MQRPIGKIAAACGGKLINCRFNTLIDKIVINDKEVDEKCLYVAIKGESFDGNDFALSAYENGATAVLVENEIPNLPCIVVKDTRKALCEIGGYFRGLERSNVISVTGSYGKTTVKELCAAVLGQKLSVLKTEGNKNNLIGLPLTLLSNDESKCAVVELGISEVGEMEMLSQIASPDAVIITAIGLMHAKTLGTRENIAAQKLKILSYAKENSPLIIPENEPLLRNSGSKIIITVAIESDTADYSAYNLRFCENGTFFDVKRLGKPYIKNLFVPIIGSFGALDSLFAVAIAEINGLNSEQIKKGLSEYKPVQNRQNIIEKNGVTLLADCYNFGPNSALTSLEALDILANQKNAKQTVVFFGSMLELGDISEQMHRNVGKTVAKYGFDALITLGNEAKDIGLGAKIGGMDEKNVFSYSDAEREQAAKKLCELVGQDCVALVKGSRKMKMEEFIPFLWKR